MVFSPFNLSKSSENITANSGRSPLMIENMRDTCDFRMRQEGYLSSSQSLSHEGEGQLKNQQSPVRKRCHLHGLDRGQPSEIRQRPAGELAGCGGDALAKIKNSTVASSVCGAEDGSRPRGVGGNFGGQGGCRMCSQSV